GVDTDSWMENTITWNNAPTSQAAALGSSLVNNQLKYYEFDVTDYVENQIPGDTIVSFTIKDPTNADKILSFNSKENVQNPPTLIITSIDPANNKFSFPFTSSIHGDTTFNKNSGTNSTLDQAGNKLALFSLEEVSDSKNNFEKPRLYPNPIHRKFNIEFPGTYQGNLRIRITSITGRNYDIANIHLKAGGSNMEIDISKLSLNPGVYYVTIHSENGKAEIIKIIII
ncbi:MAG: DNRLRE domain-containing protein, partial [Ginsengibacter sp.]